MKYELQNRDSLLIWLFLTDSLHVETELPLIIERL